MNILQPYQGNKLSAVSASELLDIDTILKCCQDLEEMTVQIGSNASKLSSVGSVLDKNALSVDGLTLLGTVDDSCKSIIVIQKNILSYISQIREAACKKYNSMQQALNDEAKSKDIN